MTATEMLVSSRLMKTDDSPREAVKRNKKQEDEQTEKYTHTQKIQNQIQNASQKKQKHSSAVYPSALCLPLFVIVFPLSYLAWLPPHFSHTMHTHPPLLFHSHTLSHSGSGPLEVYGNGPQFCLSGDRPVVRVRALSEVRGGSSVRKNETEKTRGKKEYPSAF